MLPLPISLTDLQIDGVLRYMGTPPTGRSPAIRKLAEGCARELLGVVRPRWAARDFELTPEEGRASVLRPAAARGGSEAPFGGVPPGGTVLRHPVRPGGRPSSGGRRAGICSGPWLWTAAPPPRWSSCAIRSSWSSRGSSRLLFPFRYSPGYGDLPLTLQSSLLALLDAPRQVGLCASASHILTPRKSVTAILGVADHPIQASVRSCLGCPAHDGCQYRKSGGHCGIS